MCEFTVHESAVVSHLLFVVISVNPHSQEEDYPLRHGPTGPFHYDFYDMEVALFVVIGWNCILMWKDP